MALAQVSVVDSIVTVEVGGTALLAPLVAAAAASAAAANDDAVQTAADRIATAADRVQTGLDKVATAADRVQTGLDRVQTGLDRVATGADAAAADADRVAAESAAADATASKLQAQSAALAATTGGLLTVMPAAPFTGVPSPFLLQVPGAGTAIYTHDTVTATLIDWINPATFETVQIMLAFTGALGPVGAKVFAGLYQYEVVSSGAHVTTAGGVGLIVLPDVTGYQAAAFGIDMTGTTASDAALTVANATALAAGYTLNVSGGRVRLAANFTFTAAVNVPEGGDFTLDSGVTLTFNNRFTAGRYQVFLGAGVGPTFGANSVDEIYVEWFGAKARGASAANFDSYPGIIAAMTCASRGLQGLTYKVTHGQGIYDSGTEISIPTPGLISWHGQGLSTQLRPMNTGAGFPVALARMTGSTTDSRISGIHFFCGGSSRPTDFGVRADFEMKHTNFLNCYFSYAAVAGILSTDWCNAFTLCEFSMCGVGVWLGGSANNNDIDVQTCRFVSCDVSVATAPGANIRISNCQAQASVTAAPWTKVHFYLYSGIGVHLDNVYCESQPQGGMAGMEFTVPTTVRIYADIVINGNPYYTDILGTSVTTTLEQNASATGTVGEVSNTLFASPSYSYAGAGGAAYTAGAVNLVAAGGSGTLTTANCTVVGGVITGITGAAGGKDWQVGDWFTVDQGGNVSAHGTVVSVTTNNAIASVQLGGAAAVYPGNCRSWTMRSCVANTAYLVLYNDPTICNPRRLVMNQCTRVPSGADFLLVGPTPDTVKSRFENILLDNLAFERMGAYSSFWHGIDNYFPNNFTFTPTVSAFTRQSALYQGLPDFRITLNPGQQTSDPITGSMTIASSGGGNTELRNRRVYLSLPKQESAANVKLRITLSFTNGTSTVTKQNYDNSTVFTKSVSVEREEVSIMVGPLGGTLSWTIEVIAATAASQYVSFYGMPILTPVGWGVERFSRDMLSGPLRTTASWTPASIAAAGNEELNVVMPGLRTGDPVVVGLPGETNRGVFTPRVSAFNNVKLRWDNFTSGPITPGGGAYPIEVRIV